MRGREGELVQAWVRVQSAVCEVLAAPNRDEVGGVWEEGELQNKRDSRASLRLSDAADKPLFQAVLRCPGSTM